MILNCDMGESFGQWQLGLDDTVMPYVDMANIACGFHASDPLTMQKTVALAHRHGVKIGAHPAYPDLVGFGRRHLACSPSEIKALILYQLGALSAFCKQHKAQLSYIKPHGALYNDMMKDPKVLAAILEATAEFAPQMALMVMAKNDNSDVIQLAHRYNVPLIFEAFADRRYDDEGMLMSRQLPGAVFHTPEQILEQVENLSQNNYVISASGKKITIKADTLCVHGDNADSVALIQQIKQRLSEA